MKSCICGEDSEIKFVGSLGRYKDKLITVHHVPTNVCKCGETSLDGSVALKVAKRVEDAYLSGLTNINYAMNFQESIQKFEENKVEFYNHEIAENERKFNEVKPIKEMTSEQMKSTNNKKRREENKPLKI